MNVTITGSLCQLPLQEAMCKEKGYPMFAPKSGKCYRCNYRLEDTDQKHITGCPNCNRSWCD